MSFDSVRSGGTSGRKSKRSLDSIRLNDPKKQKTQKTLGASWGANSLSSSRSALARKSPFSDFGSYMTVKNKKLHDQFDAQASNSGDRGSISENAIFRGVSIFVDGFTVPSSQELRGYMLRYGGKYENYFSRHRVTHIICSNLPNSKLKNIRSFSGGLPVVKPTWILDSVSANKLLSWVPYQLDQLINKQPRLSDIFAPKKLLVSEKPLIMNTENEYMSSKGDLEEGFDLSEERKTTESAQKVSGGSDDISDNKVNPSIEDQTIESNDYLDIEVPDTDDSDAEDNNSAKHMGTNNDFDAEVPDSDDSGAEDNNSAKNSKGDNDLDMEVPETDESGTEDNGEVKDGDHSSALSDSESSYGLDNQVRNDNQVTKELPGSTASGSYGSHSTLTDPNFVENYFKNSRLHFIGTWRNRYRKRFLGTPKGNNSHGVSQRTTVIHIDMDCFFVSAVIRKQSELKDKPVAVCHSDSPNGTSEISSANYPARNYGVKAGMFVRDAKNLCPQLVIVPYNFEAYAEIADQFYNILHKHCKKVQAVSCDEAFVEATDLELQDPEILASTIRKEIFENTGCTASAGIAGNMLLSRLATRNAKPDGQCHILPEKVDEYLDQLPIKVLPGIGHVLGEKLKKQNVETCGELRKLSKDSLQKDFGAKTGEMLWSYSRGIDNRPVGMLQECKSVGADVNWGVRFKTPKDSQNFLATLCKEVSLRLQGSGVHGRTVTLKIKKRRKDAKEPAKYMGHGDCENLSHSITIPVATDDVEVLQRIAKQLLGLFNIDVTEIRGVGMQVTKLENVDPSKQGPGKYSLRSWLKSPSESKEKQQCNNALLRKKSIPDCKDSGSGVPYQARKDTLVTNSVDENRDSAEPSLSSNSAPPPLSDLDFGVIESLPPEILSELNGIYGGKLVEFVAKSKSKGKGKMGDGQGKLLNVSDHREKLSKNDKGEQEKVCKNMPSLNMADLHEPNIMPVSLSQVDKSVLEQLPPELREDILNQLAERSKRGSSSNTSFQPISKHPPEAADVYVENNLPKDDSVSDYELWVGSPPKWVNEFSESSCVLLKLLATMYFKLGLAGNLSLILRCAISECQHLLDEGYAGQTEPLQRFSEVLRQYVKLKIRNDIEEIYLCFRLLQRFKLKSKFLLHVYENVFPDLQVQQALAFFMVAGDKYEHTNMARLMISYGQANSEIRGTETAELLNVGLLACHLNLRRLSTICHRFHAPTLRPKSHLI